MSDKNKPIGGSMGNFNLADLSGVTDAVKERIYERAKSPFVSTFIIAWSAINFRAIYALITSDSYSEAYQTIDLKVWIGLIETISMVFLFPVASTFLYLAAVPLLEEFAVKLWVRGKIKVRSARAAIEESAALEGESIQEFSRHILSLEQDGLRKLSQLRTEHSSAIEILKNKLEYLRNKNCRSIFTHDNARQTIHNMDEIERDILWISNKIQGHQGNMISSKVVFDAVKSIHTNINFREVNKAITNFSSECYIDQEVGDIITDVSFQLSVRGRNLAEVMAAEGITPKSVRDKDENELRAFFKSIAM